ncbi:MULTISPECIES: zinc-ribbon domain-containing protein [unclassified Ligilactobacillus]|uniref:zinc-ribbon domain-containing protein n=1 Tax=unclassified Ligilactobacillus TaxID=2767920 RepID=UPI003852B718
MYTCERCGHQLEGNQDKCAFCGARQQRDNATGEKKKCKKCHRDIPVNANFCPYCGADQAYLDPNELHQEEEEDLQGKTVQGDRPIRVTTINSEEDLQRFLMEMQQQMQREQQRVPHLPRNESAEPGIIPSTKLMMRDTFVLGKRMGRADFWWGTLGLVLLLACYTVVVGLGVQLLVELGISKTLALRVGFTLGMAGTTAAVICNLTAQVRRFHDAELPAFFFLFIILLGDIPLLLLCIKGQVITNDRYTFQAPRERMIAFEQHFQQHQQEAKQEEEQDEAENRVRNAGKQHDEHHDDQDE